MREPDRYIYNPGEFSQGQAPSYFHTYPGKPILLQVGKLYTRRKNTEPVAYSSEDDRKITGAWAWRWVGSPPFVYIGETIVQRTDGMFSPYTYFSFFNQEAKIWIEKKDLRYIKKFRMKNN